MFFILENYSNSTRNVSKSLSTKFESVTTCKWANSGHIIVSLIPSTLVMVIKLDIRHVNCTVNAYSFDTRDRTDYTKLMKYMVTLIYSRYQEKQDRDISVTGLA